ncbi:hypothetical protein BJ875DRAFT_128716 [Amylocarpus encephaloides]|uniref:Fucose-specific lectin n=1 Tax=Amylocarpus encephaloides TaxID=45428 RepID=A0A9P7YDL2_9HELO|nr:hypothetical protein BJ875DRAFT_128716 [Amylocarpus encephaloides]
MSEGLSTKTSREGDGSEASSLGTHGGETSWDEERKRDLGDIVFASQETFSPPIRPNHNIKTPPEKPHIQTRKAIAVANWPNWNIRVYFQDSSRHIQEVCQMERSDGAWNITPGHIGIEDAKQGTPLAVISRFSGSQTCLHYISDRNTIHGRCFIEGKGWSCDSLNNKEISVSQYSNLAAVASAIGIRIYYQSVSTNVHAQTPPLRRAAKRPLRLS